MTAPPQTTGDVATLLRHTPRWVRAQCSAGRLPHHRVGKYFLFTQDDIDAIMAATAVEVRPERPAEPVQVRSRGSVRFPYVSSETA